MLARRSPVRRRTGWFRRRRELQHRDTPPRPRGRGAIPGKAPFSGAEPVILAFLRARHRAGFDSTHRRLATEGRRSFSTATGPHSTQSGVAWGQGLSWCPGSTTSFASSFAFPRRPAERRGAESRHRTRLRNETRQAFSGIIAASSRSPPLPRYAPGCLSPPRAERSFHDPVQVVGGWPHDTHRGMSARRK